MEKGPYFAKKEAQLSLTSPYDAHVRTRGAVLYV